MLTGLLETSAGAVFFGGHDIARDPVSVRQRLGYVPEEPNLYTFQSATEYLEWRTAAILITRQMTR